MGSVCGCHGDPPGFENTLIHTHTKDCEAFRDDRGQQWEATPVGNIQYYIGIDTSAYQMVLNCLPDQSVAYSSRKCDSMVGGGNATWTPSPNEDAVHWCKPQYGTLLPSEQKTCDPFKSSIMDVIPLAMIGIVPSMGEKYPQYAVGNCTKYCALSLTHCQAFRFDMATN